MQPKPIKWIREELDPSTVGVVTTYLESTHGLLDIFLSMDATTLRSIPDIVYTRMFYAVVILTKLVVCVRAPEGAIGRILEYDSLKTTFYLRQITVLLQNAAKPDNFSVPCTFHSILNKLAEWH
jgi:hypothetical protein